MLTGTRSDQGRYSVEVSGNEFPGQSYMQALSVGELSQATGRRVKDSSGPRVDTKPPSRQQTIDNGIRVLGTELAAPPARANSQKPLEMGPNSQFLKTVVERRSVNA